MTQHTHPCAAVTRPGAFAQIPADVIVQASARALRVYAFLARHVDASGHAWPSERHLADDAGVSLSTIERGVAELVALGAIVVVGRRSTRGGAVNVYALGDARPQVAVKSDGQPDEPREVAVTSDGRLAVKSDGQNETQRNETHHARPRETADRCRPRPPSGGADDVDRLLERLPSRVTQRVTPSSHHGLRKALRALLEQQQTVEGVARRLREAPDLVAGARDVGAVLRVRLEGMLEDDQQPAGGGCRDCAGSPWGEYEDGWARLCPAHGGAVAVAA